ESLSMAPHRTGHWSPVPCGTGDPFHRTQSPGGSAPRLLCTVHNELCTAIQPTRMSNIFPALPVRVLGALAQAQGAPSAGAVDDPTRARGQLSEKSIVRASDARAPPALAHDLLWQPHKSRVWAAVT